MQGPRSGEARGACAWDVEVAEYSWQGLRGGETAGHKRCPLLLGAAQVRWDEWALQAVSRKLCLGPRACAFPKPSSGNPPPRRWCEGSHLCQVVRL